jgi:predicted transcriptional regulator
MGRPRIGEAGLTKTMIYLNPEAHQRLRHIAVDERVSMAELIRRAIDDFLRKHPERGRRGLKR